MDSIVGGDAGVKPGIADVLHLVGGLGADGGMTGVWKGRASGMPWDRLRFDAATVWSMPTMDSKLVPAELLDPVVAYFNPRRVIMLRSVARGDDGRIAVSIGVALARGGARWLPKPKILCDARLGDDRLAAGGNRGIQPPTFGSGPPRRRQSHSAGQQSHGRADAVRSASCSGPLSFLPRSADRNRSWLPG